MEDSHTHQSGDAQTGTPAPGEYGPATEAGPQSVDPNPGTGEQTGEPPEAAGEETTGPRDVQPPGDRPAARPRRSRRVVRTSGAPAAGTVVTVEVPAPATGSSGAPDAPSVTSGSAVTSGSGTRSRRKATAAAGPPPAAPVVVERPASPEATDADRVDDAPPDDAAPQVPAADAPAGAQHEDPGTDGGEPGAGGSDPEASESPAGEEPGSPEQARSASAAAGTPAAEAAEQSDPEQSGDPGQTPESASDQAGVDTDTPADDAQVGTGPSRTATDPDEPEQAPAAEAGPDDAGAEEPGEDGAGQSTGGSADEDSPARRPGFQVLFQPPTATQEPVRRRAASRPAGPPPSVAALTFASPDEARPEPAKRPVEETPAEEPAAEDEDRPQEAEARRDEADGDDSPRRRRRRGGRGRRRRTDDAETAGGEGTDDPADAESADTDATAEAEEGDSEQTAESGESSGNSRRRRRRRRSSSSEDNVADEDESRGQGRSRRARTDEVTGVKGSTRLEAKRQRRREGRESGRRRHVLTEAEFLARRESVVRTMLVRERSGLTQIVVLEDGVLVEHYVARKAATSMIGNVYLGRVQNVLPSMEAAFVDIGKGRNAVLYAGEVNWDAAGLAGQPRRIELALKSGDPVLVQVSKDPVGHKGARLTSQISLPGRYLVYVPNSSITGISRKLPDTERSRLKKILRGVVPEDAGVIVRTAAEGASETELERDVTRLRQRWEQVSKRSGAVHPPTLLHSEPDLTIKVIRDVFNEDFKELVVSGEQATEQVTDYVQSVAPDLADRVTVWDRDEDLFAEHRVDEQIAKALERKVWLPSGGSLVIDRTEAMTVIDVNTGKFVGSGGNLEETVTRNNLEAAEEIVRQLRLRDIGGIIVVDFIDMVLEANRDLVLRRLVECLGRDRTKHQVAEVTSLGLVQMTRKRMGQGLLEAFSETCPHCSGRGVHIHDDLVPATGGKDEEKQDEPKRQNEAAKVAQAARKAKERAKAAGKRQPAAPETTDEAAPEGGAGPASAEDAARPVDDAAVEQAADESAEQAAPQADEPPAGQPDEQAGEEGSGQSEPV